MAIGILLHNIRSAHNVGSLFRSADGAGVSCIYLSGYTPLPIDSFGRVQKDIAKTALGAEKSVPWQKVTNVQAFFALNKKEGATIVGVEQDERSVNYKKFVPPEKCILVLGNEVRGMSPSLRKLCDRFVEIPMRGKKESLNVSVAGALVMFEYC